MNKLLKLSLLTFLMVLAPRLAESKLTVYSRVYTFINGQILTHTHLEDELNAPINWLENTLKQGGSYFTIANDDTLRVIGFAWLDTSEVADDAAFYFGDDEDFWLQFDSANSIFEFHSTDTDGAGADGIVFDIDVGTNDVRFNGGLGVDGQTAPTAGMVLNGNIDLTTSGNRIDLDTDNDTSIRASADDVITFEAASDELSLSATALYPETDDGLALGIASTNEWGDQFNSSGFVENYDNGDVTITHSAGKLTYGGDGAVELDFNNHEMTNVDINGGTIDGAVIGASSAAAGTFTTAVFDSVATGGLSANRVSNLDTVNTADHTVTSTATYAGATIANLGTVSAATSITSTAFVGPIDGIVGGNTPAAGSFTTVDGSVITGTGILSTSDATEATNTTTASLKTAGGIAWVKDAYVGDDVFNTSGAVYDWDGGDVTWTHSAGKLTLGGDGAVEVDYGSHEQTNVDINSGTVEATIGATTPAAGTFTTITANTSTTSSVLTTLGGSTVLTGNIDITGSTGQISTNADSTFVTRPTSNLIESAHKVIRVSLYDQSVMWNRQAFHAKSKNTSWYKELGPMPDELEIRVTAGEDSLVIWDMQTGEEWMIFVGAPQNMLRGTTIPDFAFLDGRLYTAGGSGGYGVNVIDFLRDSMQGYMTQGMRKYNGDITNRNAAGDVFDFDANAIVNNTVNAVAVIRDPEGSEDEFGRKKQIFQVTTASGTSISDAGIENIYDEANTGVSYTNSTITPQGFHAYISDGGVESAQLYRNILADIGTGDGWNEDYNMNSSKTGSNDIPTPAGSGANDLVLMPQASVAHDGDPVVFFAQNDGLSVQHINASSGNENSGLTFILRDTVNTGGWSNTVVDAWGFHGLNDAPFGMVWTANGTPTFATGGKIGNGLIGLDGSTDYLTRSDAGLAVGAGDFSISIWYKSTSATNPAGSEYIFELRDSGTVGNFARLYLDTAGLLKFWLQEDGVGSDQAAGAVDLYDGKWHHIVCTGDDTNDDLVELYVDGELHDTESWGTADGDLTFDEIAIGGSNGGGNLFAGDIDELVIIPGRFLTPKENRWMYQRGLRGRGTDEDYLASNDVDYIAVDEASGFVAVGNQDSVVVLDQFLIPITGARYGTPGGAIDDVALWTAAGQDSIGLIVGAANATQWIQPPQLLAEAGAQQQTEIVVPRADIGWHRGPSNLHLFDAVVDSAGNGDYTNVDDAIDALGAGASIFIKNGTYPPFTMDVHNLHIVGENWFGTVIDGGTTADAVTVSSADNGYLGNMTVKTDAGQGNSYAGIDQDATYAFTIERIYIPDVDDDGIQIDGSTDYYTRVIDCYIVGSDDDAIFVNGPNVMVTGCRIQGTSGIGIHVGINGDYFVIMGNTIWSATSTTIVSGANYGTNCVNSQNLATSDSGTGNSVSLNSVF